MSRLNLFRHAIPAFTALALGFGSTAALAQTATTPAAPTATMAPTGTMAPAATTKSKKSKKTAAAAAPTTASAAPASSMAPATSTAATTAKSTGSLAKFTTVAAAQASCPTDTVVWSSMTKTKSFHLSTSKYYGKTKHGAYVCQQAAVAAGYHASKT